jgi:hydroxyethylthiazole kinase
MGGYLMLDDLLSLRAKTRANAPLIHCLTNHITSNDCANAILAVGGRPIMAEHPKETRDITKSADALLVNLGNISDIKMRAMLLSGQEAADRLLPCVLDLVGVAASRLRLDFAKMFITKCRPRIIKGNISELIAVYEDAATKRGVDADPADKELSLEKRLELAVTLARKYQAVILISGAQDVLASPDKQYLVKNGHPLLAAVTGTGCMQGALAAAFAGWGGSCLEAALLAALLLGVSAEAAAREATGPGLFKYKLFDSLYNLSDEVLINNNKVEVASW